VSTASGFIGLFGSNSGSITFIFHGKGWDDGSGDDFTNVFQSEVYRTGQGKNKVNTEHGSSYRFWLLGWQHRCHNHHNKIGAELRRTWHPGTDSSIPQNPMRLRLHARSGFCHSSMPDGGCFQVDLMSFSYTPTSASGLLNAIV